MMFRKFTKVSFGILAMLMMPFASAAETVQIVLATPDFPPYFSQSNPDQGFYTEIVREALRRSGYSLEVEFMPFERGIQMANHGEISGILGALMTPDRQQKFYFSEPVSEVEVSLFGRSEREYTFNSIADLKGYKIGVMRGASLSAEFDQADFLHKEEITNQLQNISKLMSNRIDLFACEKQHILHLVHQYHPEWEEQIRALEPVLDVRTVHIMLSKDKPIHRAVIQRFNTQLANMRQDGSYQHIVESHKNKFAPETLESLAFVTYH